MNANIRDNGTAASGADRVTIGLDLGEHGHHLCALDAHGMILEETRTPNSREALAELARKYPGARVIIECGQHSPWVSHDLAAHGCEVIVANARKARFIYQCEGKCDRRDAVMLARIGRLDWRLLHPVDHRSQNTQRDLAHLRLRDTLVAARVKLVNSVRGTLKSLGERTPRGGTQGFARRARAHCDAAAVELMEPMLKALDVLDQQIRHVERHLEKLCLERYPEAQRLQQVDGVGPVTALCFVLTLESPARLARTRDVGSYLGLTPRRDQSGGRDRQLPISKCGDAYLRRLLVSCAHHIIGPFGKESCLRAHGLRLCERGGINGKKRAAIAVARKLSVLLLSLWKSGEDYQPLPQTA